jgi:putative Mg2+ transporter-C (MgtC) family protein
MSTTITWPDIAIRLALTILAGGLIGVNRGEHGHPAGLRTTLLVCLAASLSMIQVNLLLATGDRHGDSFIMMDLMRLPLGILSGMGFIGGGVILKRENLVVGVTTAATLWFVTVMGLCFGGGQLALGSIAFLLGMIVLWFLKSVELRLPSVRRGALRISIDREGPSESEVKRIILADGLEILSIGVFFDQAEQRRDLVCELRWRVLPTATGEPAFLQTLEKLAGIRSFRWSPQGLRASLEE